MIHHMERKTWSIFLKVPGELQQIALKVYILTNLEAGYPLLTGSILTIHGSNCILGISKIIKLHKCKPWRLAGYPNTETITSHHINQQS